MENQKCRGGKWRTGKWRTGKWRTGKWRTGKWRTKNAGVEDAGLENARPVSLRELKKAQKIALHRCITFILSYAAVVFNVPLKSAKTHCSDTNSAKKH